MIVFKVYGTGCAKCQTLYDLVVQAIQETECVALVEKVTDIQKIIDAGLLLTPGLSVDGVLKVAGRLPKIEEIKKFIKESQND
jgi:small redox-active disulfide protein 2